MKGPPFAQFKVSIEILKPNHSVKINSNFAFLACYPRIYKLRLCISLSRVFKKRPVLHLSNLCFLLKDYQFSCDTNEILHLLTKPHNHEFATKNYHFDLSSKYSGALRHCGIKSRQFILLKC